MKQIAMIAAALTAACTETANGTPEPAAPPPVTDGDIPGDCPLTIRFGSYAMGIDREAFTAIEALLANDAAVERVDRKSWGREGERTLCVWTRSPGDAKRLAMAAKRLIPAKPRGPVTVSVGGPKR